VNFQYKRVSRQRTCFICGKPDWCSYSPDGNISFCARIVANADRISRTGWGVFYHEKRPFPKIPVHFPVKARNTKPELAPLEIRDFVYRNLLYLSPATDSKELIDGRKGLRERGILDFGNYGFLPKTINQRTVLANRIVVLLKARFPSVASSHFRDIVRIPGFWIDNTGKARLWRDINSLSSILLIPYRDSVGFIQACQLRFMGNANRKQLRYLWFSVPRESGGVSSGSPLHFACDFSTRKNHGKPLLVTEGALKAQSVQNLLPEFRVIGNGGVTCSHLEIVSSARFAPLIIGFDIDYLDNQHIARAIARLIALRFYDSERFGYPANVKILWWNTVVNGLDEALLTGIPVSSLGVSEWLSTLNCTARDEAISILSNRLLL
jgi:hypothetical protein